MLVELAQRGDLLTTWLVLTVLTFLLTIVMSAALFRLDDSAPTFERRQRKSNPAFPKPSMVRREILQWLMGYGVHLHWGYELAWPDAHHPWINTAFQHDIHHAKSTLNKPMHTGSFIKIWDNLLGSTCEAPPDSLRKDQLRRT